MKLFVSFLCPDCPKAIELMDASGKEYELLDISKSLGALKEFLKYRDERVEFDPVKENGSIGVPMLVDDQGKISFDFEK